MTESEYADALATAKADPTLVSELIETLNGRHRFLVRGAIAKATVLYVFLVVAVAQFFVQETTMAMVAWATAATMCVTSLGSLGLYFLLQVDRVAINRDLKRVEFQLALLIERMDNQLQTVSKEQVIHDDP